LTQGGADLRVKCGDKILIQRDLGIGKLAIATCSLELLVDVGSAHSVDDSDGDLLLVDFFVGGCPMLQVGVCTGMVVPP